MATYRYDDASIDKMTNIDEVKDLAKYLRDRIKEGYDYLITKNGQIKNADDGQFEAFDDFLSNFKEKLIECLTKKL